MITWEDYARKVLGNKRVNELIKQYGLCTKKWTYGRSKAFYRQLKQECREKEKESGNNE